jgi:protein AroM
MKKVGLITIGQSPRPDVTADMAPLLGGDVVLLERGALDGLSRTEVRELSPGKGMMPLCTRLRDGSEVIIAEEKIVPRVAALVADLNANGASLILLLCVGAFPEFESSCLVVYPQRIVTRWVEGLIGKKHRLGLVVPILEQREWARGVFDHITRHITITDASPYGDRGPLSRASLALKEADCDLIVMYCMGFNRELVREFREVTGKPVLVPSSLVARTAAELLE